MLQISTTICGYGDETWITEVNVLEMNETFYELKITGHGQCFHAMENYLRSRIIFQSSHEKHDHFQ